MAEPKVPKTAHELQQVTSLCLLGMTDVQLGEFYGVTSRTIEKWRAKHPSFRKAVAAGKVVADSQAALGLHQRAVGCTIRKQKAINVKGEIQIVDLLEDVPPDPQAALKWLHNRQREYWRFEPETLPTEAKLDLMAMLGEFGKRFGEGMARELANKAGYGHLIDAQAQEIPALPGRNQSHREQDADADED